MNNSWPCVGILQIEMIIIEGAGINPAFVFITFTP